MNASVPVPVSRLVAESDDRARIVFGSEAVTIGELVERGTRRFGDGAAADVVGLVMTNDRPTVEVVLGAVLTGCQVVSLPLPGRGADLDEYAAHLRAICARHDVAEVVVTDQSSALLAGLGIAVRPHSQLDRAPLAVPGRGLELVQFTSGSTRRPRPVALHDDELGADVAAVLEVVAPRPGDALVSWLPLAHDMGLVGMLLAGVAAGGPRWAGGGDLVLLDPRDFLRRPTAWIEALSHWRAAFTAAPDFAFRRTAERRPAPGLDLSSLRCAIVGGEIVRAGTLAAFADAYAHEGLDATALCPAYGLAELGVAATLTPPGVSWRETVVGSGSLADSRLRAPGPGEGVTTLVASGPALPGYDVAAPAGEVGQLAVRGPSLGRDADTGVAFAGPDGWHHTGDAGFVDDDGWLFVCGRIDDWVVAHGRNIYAPAVEDAVGSLAGVRTGRVTAVGLPTGEWAVVAEPAGRSPLDAPAIRALQRETRRVATDVAGARPDDVVVVEPGTLPLTSSGKIQRNQVRARLLRDEVSPCPTA